MNLQKHTVPQYWICDACTYKNHIKDGYCAMCLNKKNKSRANNNHSSRSLRKRKLKSWNCSVCTLINPSHSSLCNACGYSKNDENKVFKFKEEILRLDEAEKLKVNDQIDHRDNFGKIAAAKVIQKKGTNLQIRYIGWSEKYDIWCDYKNELNRFFAHKSIFNGKLCSDKRKVLKKGDYVNFNPMSKKRKGWNIGYIKSFDKYSDQIDIYYRFKNRVYHNWTHLENDDEIKVLSSNQIKTLREEGYIENEGNGNISFYDNKYKYDFMLFISGWLRSKCYFYLKTTKLKQVIFRYYYDELFIILKDLFVNKYIINTEGMDYEFEVSQLFWDSMDDENIDVIGMVKIEKNYKQNLLIYESLLSTMKDKTEKILFHGTSFDNIDKIIYNGFNRDFNIASRYGKGSYFAKSAKLASKYCFPHKNGQFYSMLICRVIIGKYTLGKKEMDHSSLWDINNGIQYHSLVDNMLNPSIFVINRDYHAIPIYIICFKYKTNMLNN